MMDYQEMTRLGQGWSVMNTTALAALVVRPSTVANLTLWNGEAGGGKSYILDRVFAHSLVTTAAESRFGIWLCVHRTGMAAPTSDITAIKGNAGKRNYGGRAIVDTAATVIDDGWFPWGPSVSSEPTGVLPGAQMSVEVAGRLIVPPSSGISIQVVSSITTDTYTCGFSWYEQALELQ